MCVFVIFASSIEGREERQPQYKPNYIYCISMKGHVEVSCQS